MIGHPRCCLQPQFTEAARNDIGLVPGKDRRCERGCLRSRESSRVSVTTPEGNLIFSAMVADCRKQLGCALTGRDTRVKIDQATPAAGVFQCKGLPESPQRGLFQIERRLSRRSKLGSGCDDPEPYAAFKGKHRLRSFESFA